MTHTTPVPHESPEWDLMAKALRGELSDEEKIAFSAWLGQEEAHAIQWAEAMATWQKVEATQNNTFEPNVGYAWEKFCARVDWKAPVESSTLPEEPVVRPMFALNTLAKYAALFVLAAGLAWLGYTQFNTPDQWAQVATLAGERRVFFLPDSSRVVLNENSTLRYQEGFKGEERQVQLEGEGFFNVRKNPNQPFLITSGQTQIKVLGTSFNVKGLKASKEVTVTVSTGKVAFSSLITQKKVILTPGFTGSILEGGLIEKNKTSGDLATSWQTIKFVNASLKEVETTLEHYFLVDINLSNKELQQCTFTGTFNLPQLKEVFSVLSASNGLTITQPATSTYLISGDGCQ